MEDNKEKSVFATVEAILAKSAMEFDRQMKEQAKRTAELDRKLEILTEQVSGITRSNGLFAEDYFFNSFEQGKTDFFGERFDKLLPNAKGQIVEDEYDILIINGKTAGIIEIKFKARKDDIEKALKKVTTFRTNFPEYKNHKVYVAIAALAINKTVERECNKQGLAVIKQVGDKVIVYDKHLKAY